MGLDISLLLNIDVKEFLSSIIVYHFLFYPFPKKPWILHVCSTSLENTMGKREIARNSFENFSPFSSNLKLSTANSFSLEESAFCRLGKG